MTGHEVRLTSLLAVDTATRVLLASPSLESSRTSRHDAGRSPTGARDWKTDETNL
jgi:hypothetical protein